MRALAILLLLTVFIRHGAIYWLADVGGFTPAAVSYMLGGAQEMAFALVVAMLLLVYHRGIWRGLALAACGIAAIEGAQMAGCRALITDIRAVPAGMNLCDHATGLPIGQVIFALEAIWVLVIVAMHFSWWITCEKSRP